MDSESDLTDLDEESEVAVALSADAPSISFIAEPENKFIPRSYEEALKSTFRFQQ